MSAHADEQEATPAPSVTPPAERRETCPHARFSRPHTWTTGAFYWPLGSLTAHLYIGEHYVMCGGCGEIREDHVLPASGGEG